jgi:hypothetical protein
MQTNINVQALTVEAAISGKREHIYHAAMLDPHTAAELSLEQIWALVDSCRYPKLRSFQQLFRLSRPSHHLRRLYLPMCKLWSPLCFILIGDVILFL